MAGRARSAPAVGEQLGFDVLAPESGGSPDHAGWARPLVRVTPARLGTWNACPRRYRMLYLDRPPAPRGGPRAASTLGAVVHLALRAFFALPLARRTCAEAAALVDRNWSGEGFRDGAQEREYRGRAREWVAAYVAGWTDPPEPAGIRETAGGELSGEPAEAFEATALGGAPGATAVAGAPDLVEHPRSVPVAAREPLAVERWVSAQVGAILAEGRVDRIDDDGRGGAVVVDYKTGRRPEAADARDSQALALYALATERTLRRPCRRVELHHLPSGTVAAWEHDEASSAAHLARAEVAALAADDAAAALAAGGDPDALFPARPGGRCAACDVRRSCAPGRAAGPAALPWEGLAP